MNEELTKLALEIVIKRLEKDVKELKEIIADLAWDNYRLKKEIERLKKS